MSLELKAPAVFQVVLRPAARPPDDVSLESAASAGAGRSVSQGRAGDQRRRAARAHRDGEPHVAGMADDGRVAAEGLRPRRGRDHQAGCGSGRMASPDPGRDSARRLPVRLESWYRSPSGEPGWTVSYVEAVRQYPPGPEDKGCGLETLVSGWLHHRDGQLMEEHRAAREADLLRPRRRHLHAPVRPHSPQGSDLLGVSALRLGIRVVRGRVGPAEKDPLRPRSLRGPRRRCPLSVVRSTDASLARARRSGPLGPHPDHARRAGRRPDRERAARRAAAPADVSSGPRRARASAAPFAQDRIPDLRRLQPGYVVIGDSMAGTRVDERRLVELTGVQVAPLLQAGSGSAFWYLALKNWVIASGIRPRMVLIFFRDTNLTDVMFRLDEQFRWALDLAALDREDELNAVVARRLGLLHRAHRFVDGDRRGRAGAPAGGAGGDGLARRRDDVVAPPAGGVRHADERAPRPRSSAEDGGRRHSDRRGRGVRLRARTSRIRCCR